MGVRQRAAIDPGEVGGLHCRHRQRQLGLHQVAIAAQVFDLRREPGVPFAQRRERRDIAEHRRRGQHVGARIG